MINLIRKIKRFVKPDLRQAALDKINGFWSIDGWLTNEEAIGLYSIAKKLKQDAVVVEIGSWKGKSTFCIAQGLKNGTINCIDPFNAAGEEGSKEIYEKTKGEISLLQQFKTNLSTIPSTVKINTLQGYSSQFAGSVTAIDFLFIDGDHSIEGCRFDFEEYEKYLKPGAYLAFHDFDPARSELGPTWVIENLVQKNGSYVHYNTYDSLCVFRKS